MSFLNISNNLYTLLLQNLYDIMINLGVSNFNSIENDSWRTAEQRWAHDLFLFSFNIKKSWNWLQKDSLGVVIML